MNRKVGNERNRRRICVRVDRDLADRLDEYAIRQGVGREVFAEAAIEQYLNRYQRDRENPRADSSAEE